MNPTDIRQMAADPKAFRQHLLIDADGESVKLGNVMDPWQRDDFAAADPAWQRVAGKDVPDVGSIPQRFYFERPRGSSKTSDLAVAVTWALFASARSIRGVAAAADKDQSRLLRDAIEKLLRLNPWLREVIEIQAYRVVNRHTGSTLEILASDVASSWGLLVDFIVCDEVVHWAGESGEALWHSLLSASAKRSSCLLCVISNAGANRAACWQWNVRELARESSSWHFSRLDGPVASWISSDAIAEQQRLLPATVFRDIPSAALIPPRRNTCCSCL